MAKVCLKCGYERNPQEQAPDTECPKCGIIYAKVEKALKESRESDDQKPETPDPPPDAQNEKSESAAANESTEEETPEAKMERLTSALETQTQINRDKTRTMELALLVVPSIFFGLGLLAACWKLFGPLIFIQSTVDLYGKASLSIRFHPNPLPWGIVAFGVAAPFVARWIRDIRRDLR